MILQKQHVLVSGHQSCLAHCTSTCDEPDPVCDRRCVGGCQCPSNKPFWDGKKCQPSYMCPVVQGNVLRPQNLQVFSDDESNNVILTWDRVTGVDEFLVQVLSGQGSQDMVMQMPVTSNMALLQGLVRGTRYIFRVSTVNKYQNEQMDPLSSRMLTPPQKVFPAAIYKTGFQAYWIADPRAIRYKVRLLGGDQKTVLFGNENIATPSVIFKDLSPATSYYVQVASAKIQESFGNYSDMVQVTTAGEEEAADDLLDVSSIVSLDFNHITTTTKQAPTTTTTPPPPPPTTTTQATTTTTTTEAPTTTTQEATTTTRVKTTTAAPKTLPLCEQKYLEASKKAAMAAPQDRNKIVFPKCKSDGTFMSTVCSKVDPFYCSCINPHTGDKVEKSIFGPYNSQLPIKCDEFGSSSTSVSTLKIVSFTETSLSFSWTVTGAAAAYIFQLYKDDKLVKVKMLMNTKFYSVVGLNADQAFTVSVLPIDFHGKVGVRKTITAKTRRPLGLKNLIANDRRFERSDVELSWTGSGYGEIYSVKLEDCKGNILSERQVSFDKTTIQNLNPLLCYKFAVKNTKRTLQIPITAEVKPLCTDQPLDLIFAFDASKNGPSKRFFYTRKVAKEIVSSIKPDADTRVAAIKYHRNVEAAFHFTKFKTPKTMFYGVGNVTYKGGMVSNVAFALDYLRVMFFSGGKQNSGYIPRANALKVVVLFVGGDINNNVVNKARMLRQKGAILIVVGTGRNKGHLDSIASNYKLSFAGDDLSELQDAGRRIRQMTCISK